MLFKYLLTVFAFFGFGLLSSTGVFTVFVTAGLVPRLADKTHTGNKIITYENCIVAGTIFGCFFSVYPDFFSVYVGSAAREGIKNWNLWGNSILGIFGIFAGAFVGCFAIAIAEILNTIPIFTRRIRLGKGIGIVLLCMALGKTAGALLYFYKIAG